MSGGVTGFLALRSRVAPGDLISMIGIISRGIPAACHTGMHFHS